MNNKAEEYVQILKERPQESGSVVRRLVKENRRLFINLPVIGLARQVSALLQDDEFSLFYSFERTLAHKLHPQLYKNNLNVLTNSLIERVYRRKYENYSSVMDPTVKSKTAQGPEALKTQLEKLKNILISMSEIDGSFMVIKFCDFDLAKLNPKLADIVRSIEFTVNLARRSFTQDRDENFELFNSRYQDFKKKYGENFAELFRIRTSWDEDLRSYVPMLEDEKEKPVLKKSRKNLTGLVERYAQRVKSGYLDKTDSSNRKRIENIIKAVHSNNTEKFGPGRGDEILQGVMELWFADDSIDEEKKEILKAIYDEYFPEKDFDELVEDILKDEGISTEEALPVDEDNFVTDRDEEEAPVNEEVSEETFSPGDDDRFLTGGPVPSGPGGGEPGEAETGEDFEGEAASASESSNIQEDEADVLVRELLQSKEEELSWILEQISSAEAESGAQLPSLAQAEMSDKQLARIIAMLNNELYEKFRPEIFKYLAELDEENLFVKIIRYCEDGPFKVASDEEKKAIIDMFIDNYRDDEKLVKQLENYKRTIGNISELRNKIFTTLTKIERSNPNIINCINQQLHYLNKLMQSDEYRPLWKTIGYLYDNIVNQLKEETPLRLIGQVENENPFKKIQLLRYMQEFHRNHRAASKVIRERLDDAEETVRLMESYGKGEPVDPKKLFKRLFDERISPSEFVSRALDGTIALAERHESLISNEQPAVSEAAVEKAEPVEETAAVEAVMADKEAGAVEEAAVNKEAAVDNKTAADTAEPVPVENIIKKSIEYFSTLDPEDEEAGKQLPSKMLEIKKESRSRYTDVLHNILLSDRLDPVVRDMVLDSFTELNDTELSGVYALHKVINSRQDEEAFADITEAIARSGLPQELKQAVIARVQRITESRAKENAQMSILDRVSQDDSGEQNPFSAIAESGDVTAETRGKAAEINTAIEAQRIDEVILTISSSNDTPDVKIKYLLALEKIAQVKGWFDDEAVEKKYRPKIHNKIGFYQRFISKQEKEKQLFSGNREFINQLISEKRDIRTLRRDIVSRQKKMQKREEKEIDITTLPREEQVFHLSTSIIKTFNDNIDALEPVYSILLRTNSTEFQRHFETEYNKRKQLFKKLVSDTISMIKNKNSDSIVLERIQTSPPKMQYLWSRELLNYYKKSRLEEIFDVFDNDKNFYNSLIKIVKIIKGNNKGNFLQSTIEREIKLVKDISDNLSEEKLKKMKIKTRGRQDKEKIGLFRDLIKVTGDLDRM